MKVGRRWFYFAGALTVVVLLAATGIKYTFYNYGAMLKAAIAMGNLAPEEVC